MRPLRLGPLASSALLWHMELSLVASDSRSIACPFARTGKVVVSVRRSERASGRESEDVEMFHPRAAAGRGQCSKWCGEFIIGANVNVCIDAEHLRPAKKRPVLYLRAATRCGSVRCTIPFWAAMGRGPRSAWRHSLWNGCCHAVRVITSPKGRGCHAIRGPCDNLP